MLDATYVLPIRHDRLDAVDELTAYLQQLCAHVEIIVVDGSPADVWAAHHAAWGAYVTHITPDPDLITPNGKVSGVLTGVRYASHERIVLADDDVRYGQAALERVIAALDEAHVVRPQNFFDPLPWHARWDTARSLLNRLLDGDWPGTLGIRRSVLRATNGYAGDVLFENFELVRTVQAAGGHEAVLLDLFVRRLPPSASHFWSQRVRQAYDELARPVRFVVSLALLPLVLVLMARQQWIRLGLGAAVSVALAEAGRCRAHGRRVFPASATLFAPAWLIERSVCSWIALWQRLRYGGVRYHTGTLRRAATPDRVLRYRYRTARLLLGSHAVPSDPAALGQRNVPAGVPG